MIVKISSLRQRGPAPDIVIFQYP